MKWLANETPLSVITVPGPVPKGVGKAGGCVAAAAPVATIHPAEDRDIPAMAVLRAREWETPAYWEKRIRGYLAGTHHPQQALPERAVFVAEEAGRVVGFVAGHRTRRYGCDGELEWINVAVGHRRQGIAGPLLVRMGVWFVEQCAFRVCVNVAPDNNPAVALYRKYGAEELNAHFMVWADIRKVANPQS